MDTRRLLLAVTIAALPALAAAQDAHALKQVNLRAGPARDYPLVATLGPGAPLAVQGCTAGWGWCDVIGPDGVRGWVYAGNIGVPFQEQERPVALYGSVIGLPIVTFSIGSYWGSYYPNRPWYRDRARWERHAPPPGRPVMRPPGGPRPPIARPPVDHRPPPVVQPPAPRPPPVRPPEGRPPEGRPPAGRPPGGRPPEAGRPPGGDRGGERGGDRGGDRGGNDRRGEGPRPPER